jgi:hypothetical protein
LISREQVSRMRAGSVLVDVAIDQGGCFETSRATTHQDPCYLVDEVVHYCVANMPGGVARTSTLALTNATLPYVLALAGKGLVAALEEDRYLRDGLNVHAGQGHASCRRRSAWLRLFARCTGTGRGLKHWPHKPGPPQAARALASRRRACRTGSV